MRSAPLIKASDRTVLHRMLARALSGEGAHVRLPEAFEGLDWKLSGERPVGSPHSIFQILNHMNYWNDWVVGWLSGDSPGLPKKAAQSWPGRAAPGGIAEWSAAVRLLQKSLQVMADYSESGDLLANRGSKAPLKMLQTIASHNSYHAGQAVMLRRQLGAWPPPSGGLTW